MPGKLCEVLQLITYSKPSQRPPWLEAKSEAMAQCWLLSPLPAMALHQLCHQLSRALAFLPTPFQSAEAVKSLLVLSPIQSCCLTQGFEIQLQSHNLIPCAGRHTKGS